MKAYLSIVNDITSNSITSRHIESGQSIRDFVAANTSHFVDGDEQPIVTFLDGEIVEPVDWDVIIEGGQRLIIAPRPHGIDPVTLLIYAVIVVLSVVISTSLVSTPDNPEDRQTPSPSYNLNAQGNSPRLGEPIPTRYGKWRVYPDWAAAPYREFENGDEYLYQIFSVGWGSYFAENLKIGETPIANFDDIVSTTYEPGQIVDQFRPDVYTAPEVSGSGVTMYATTEPEYTGNIGPYTANASGTTTDTLIIDITFNRGLNEANDDGGLDSRTVTLEFEYREIDDAGSPIGSWVNPADWDLSYTNKTVDVLRYTVKTTVPSGRYEVRGARTNATEDSYRVSDEVVWVGLRAYLETDRTFEQTVWAVKVKATAQISAQSERKFNGEFTRKLRTWDGSAWTAETTTRNPMWAYCDAITAEYGGDYDDSNLNIAEIKAVADVCDSRGDYYDGQFDTKGTLWPALKQICSSCRSWPIQYGNDFSVVRDDGAPAATYMFNGRNTTKPIQISYQTMDQWGDDSIEIEYTDPTSWKPETIICAIPGTSASKPKKVKMPFITNAIQANREGMFLAAKYAFRTAIATINTELEGMVPQYLDGLQVVQEYLNWGVGGEVKDVDSQRLTLSEPVYFDATNYIYFRNDQGKTSIAYTATAVAGNPYQIDVVETLPVWIYTGNAKSKTFFAFTSDTAPKSMLVDSIKQSKDFEITISAVIDDPRCHQYDALINDNTITTPPPVAPVAAANLTITGVKTIHGGTSLSPILTVTWSPAPTAKRYFVEYSYDAGATWTGRQTVTEPIISLSLKKETTDIRISAQNEETGPWYQFQEDVGESFDTPETPSGFALVGGVFNTEKLNIEWTGSAQAETYYITFSNESAPGTILYSVAGITETNYSLDVDRALVNGLGREMRVNLYGVNDNNERSLVPAEITVKNNQIAQLAGVTVHSLVDALMIKLPQSSELDLAGYKIYASQTSGFTPGPTNIIEANATNLINSLDINPGETWYVRAAGFDKWGIDELNYSDQVSAAGLLIDETRIEDDSISTPKLQANSVTASEIFVTLLSAISANLGTVEAGTYRTAGGTSTRVELTSEDTLPFWIGEATKSIANGHVFYDESRKVLTIQHPSSGLYIEFSPTGSNLMWVGSGSKIDANAVFRITNTGNIYAKGIEIQDSLGNVILSAGGTLPAANVSGLGSLATANSVAYSSVTGSKPPTNADNTASNTAAGIANQGALATADDVAYSSVTGTKPPTNADNTASNTAAGIAGQGAFATLSQLTAANLATYMQSAIIGEAFIDNLAVSTAKIQGQAVTVMEGISHVSQRLLVNNTANNTPYVICTRSIDVTGANASSGVFVGVAAKLRSNGDGATQAPFNFDCYFRIRRGVTTVFTSGTLNFATTVGGSNRPVFYDFAFNYVDAIGAITGVQSYTFEVVFTDQNVDMDQTYSLIDSMILDLGKV